MTSLRFAPALLAASLFSCSLPTTTSAANDIPGLDDSELAGTYTGVLQETGGTEKYFISLAQQVTVTESGPAQLTFTSSAFPTFTGIVITIGQSAVNLNLANPGASGSVQVQEVAFAKNADGTWILVIQSADTADGAANALVQFASYEPQMVPASDALAVDYLDQMFALASSAAK